MLLLRMASGDAYRMRLRADRRMTEWERLRQIWVAFGCEQNPDDFNPAVRDRMWEQIAKMARESAERNGRVYRENQQLEAEVRRLRLTYEPSEQESS